MKGKKVFVIIFLVLLLVLGYFIYDKYYKTNKVYTEDLIIKESEDILNNKISNLYVLFDESNNEINSMSNDEKLILMALYIKNLDSYKSSKILRELKNLFGEDFNIEFNDIKRVNDPDKMVYKYNTKTKKYTKESDILGLDLILPLKSELVNFKKQEDTYILTYNQMFYNELSENGKLDIVNIKGEKLFDIKLSDSISITNEMFNKYKDKLITTDYIFKIENNRLILKGYELK